MSKKDNDWKKREGIVYSTNQDFDYTDPSAETATTLPPQKQRLRVMLDKSGRAGKQVTMVTGFIGTAEDLEKLTKLLKTRCGAGGSCKDNEILIQGDVRDKLIVLLQKEGYRV